MSKNALRVRVEKGPTQGKKHKVKTEAIIMGSDESVDVVLPVEGVSPRHAQIVFQGGRVQLEDLGSEEGTFRNGRQLLGPVQVFPGDRIGLGPNVVLILEGDDPGAEPSTEEENDLNLGLAHQDSAEV